MARIRFWQLLLACVLSTSAYAEQHGTVTFGGYPVPGATVTVSQGKKTFTTSTDVAGRYSFPELQAGAWKLHVDMMCFEPHDQDVTSAEKSESTEIVLKLTPLDQILAKAQKMKAQAITAAAADQPSKPDAPANAAPKPSEESAANDGLLINGSSANAATSQYSIARAFGNQRSSSKALYTGGLGLHLGNSVLDARPYSLTGLDLSKPGYSRVTVVGTLGGPIRIPHLIRSGPNFFVAYQWTRNSVAQGLAGLVPTLAQRTPVGFTIDPVAQSLLDLYPLPNITSNGFYNYQRSVLNGEHVDALQLRLDKSIGRKDSFNGQFNSENSRSDNTNLFGFRDTTAVLGLNGNINWQRRVGRGLYGTLGYRFSRLRTDVTPYFLGKTNVAGNAGMTGNLQDARNWGPPTLTFASGIAALNDAQSAFNRNRTEMVTYSVAWYRGKHNVQAGGDFRRQEFNYLQQIDPRGTFNFTGAAFGNDFTDFLRGVPDTASIAYGNADKYLRQSLYNLYASDDWRLRPDFTINAGLRWEYGSPINELKNRLVNLDVASGFTAVAQTLASDPTGTLTGQHYPRSLIRPDRNNVQPRIGFSWRPIPASSLVVRGGYGIYADTSVYQGTALSLAQQAPFSRTVTANNTTCAQSLKTGPNPCSSSTANTFAIDPDFKVGFAQTWQLAVQRDLPWAMQATATYNGVKGSDGVQEFLPNTYAPGAANPCVQCPVGFLYRTSHGSSIRNAGTLQLRRRLRSGFTSTLLYTFSKSIDNDSILGGQGPVASGVTTRVAPNETIAQNWRNLQAERSRSSFDQRHVFSATFQYTTGMGLGGGTLLHGWKGRLYKEWAVAGEINAATGRPLTPIYYAALNGTGYTGVVRPDRTSLSVYDAPAGRYLNPAAFTAPQAGAFGNAGRYSITGPGQLTFDASVSRTFRLDKRWNLDIRVDATNVLNHVALTSYNTVISPSQINPTFGLPTAAQSMRTMQITSRLRF